MIIEFTIPGAPQGKARARTTKFGSYTPEKTVLYENLIKISYQQATEKYFDGPLRVIINAFYEPAKSTSKKRMSAMLEGSIRPTKKPDIDNIAKVVLDALNGIAYKDDTQVIELIVNKVYGQLASVNVTIEEVS
nr:MAG TPA: Endodeoxyribonuclease RusA [Bacteriophage sp.]